MLIALTTFRLSEPISREQACEVFRSTAPKYLAVPGLQSKRYLLSEDGATVGGIYVWESKAAAEALYTEAWRAFVRGKYGTEPSVVYFESPLWVDSFAQQIHVDA